MATVRTRDGFMSLPPRPATASVGATQRERLQTTLSNARWWSVVGGVVGTVLFTVLAVQHTNAVMAPANGSGSTTQAALPPNAPSQSLFQGQGSSLGGGGLLAPASSFGSSARSMTS